MADTLENRVRDVEMMLAHMPEDLDARFAGVDVKLAGIRETLALHTTRFSKLEGLIAQLDGRVSSLETHMDVRFAAVDRRLDALADGMAQVLDRLPPKS